MGQEGIYTRRRILSALKAQCDKRHRSITIEAQAGQGKTTTAHQFLAHENLDHLWYALTPQDRDPLFFVTRLHNALNARFSNFSPTLSSMIQKRDLSPSSMGEYARFLSEDLTRLGLPPFYLVFDDVHCVEDSFLSTAFLGRFIEGLQGGTQGANVLLTSRPPLPEVIRKPVEEGKGLFLSNAELALSRNEIREFITTVTGEGAPVSVVNHLHDLTDGWVMGLVFECHKLALGQSLGEKSTSGLASQELFFLEEVFPWMEPELLWALKRLSLLDEIPVSLAERVLGKEGAGETLAFMESRNLFVRGATQSKDHYAIHQLLRETLRQRALETLSFEERQEILLSAATWYQDEGMSEVAIGYLLRAEAFDDAASLLSVTGLELYAENRMITLQGFLEGVPEDVVERFGWLSLFYGIACEPLASERALARFRHADKAFISEGNRLGELISVCQIVYHHLTMDGRLGLANQNLTRLESLYQEMQGKLAVPLKVRLLSVITMGFCYVTDEFEKSWSYLSQSLELARKHEMPGFELEIRMTGCTLEIKNGDPQSALKVVEEMQPLFGSPRVSSVFKSFAAVVSANALALAGDYFNYDFHRRRFYAIHEKTIGKNGIHHPNLLIWEIDHALAHGDYLKAEAVVKKGLWLDHIGANPHFRSQFHDYGAIACAFLGKREEALTHVKKAVAVRKEAEAEYFFAKQSLMLGAALGALGMYDEAESHFEACLRREEVISCVHIRAGVLAHRGAMRLARRGKKGAAQDVREFLFLMKSRRLPHFYTWVPEVVASVLSFAWSKGIERPFVEALATDKLGLWFDEKGKAMPCLTIQTLGTFRLSLDGQELLSAKNLTPMQQELVSLLVISPDHRIGSETLTARFWPEHSLQKASRTLNVMLLRFRELLSDALGVDAGLYFSHRNKQVSLHGCQCDVSWFEKLAEEGLGHFGRHEHWQAANAFRHAFSLFEGETFLSGLQLAEDAQRFAEYRLRPLFNRCALAWSEVTIARGSTEPEEIAALEAAVVRGGGDEGLVKNLYEFFAENGQSRRAEKLLATYRGILSEAGYAPEEVEHEVEMLWE